MTGGVASHLTRRLCRLEGRHGLGEAVEPGHQLRMAGAPFALVAEVEIAERASERQVAVVGAGAPGRRDLLELVQRAVDLGLLAALPGGMPLLLGAEALLVDQQ